MYYQIKNFLIFISNNILFKLDNLIKTMKKYFYLITVLFLVSCKHSSSPEIEKLNKKSQANVEILTPIDEHVVNETINIKHINEVCALYIEPDSVWFNKKQASLDQQAWMEIVSDLSYYHSIAEESLKKSNIKIYYQLEEIETFVFTEKGGDNFEIIRDSLSDKWGFLLFNGKESPIFWNSIEIEELQDYYSKEI